MKITRVELLKVLELIQPGLAKKEIVEHSTSFLFIQKNVLSYNDRIAISHPLPKLDFQGAVDAGKLYGLLSKLRKPELEIEAEKNTLEIKCGRSKAGIVFNTTIAKEILSSLKLFDNTKRWVSIKKANTFVKGVAFCIPCASQNMAVPELTALHFSRNGIEACDNFRIAHCKYSNTFQDDILVPANSLIGLVDHNPLFYAIDRNWLHFKNKEEAVYSVRLLSETTKKYPKLSTILNEKTKTKIVLPSKLKEIVHRAALFGDDIIVELTKKKMIITSKSEAGWFKENANIKYKGKPFCFSIPPKTLLEIPSKDLTMEWTANTLRMNNEAFTYCCAIQPVKKEIKND